MTRQKKTLSEMLVELGLLNPEQAKEAKKEEELTKQPFRRIIVQKGFIRGRPDFFGQQYEPAPD